MNRNPKWHRDELILALDLYFRVNPIHTSEKNTEIVALSKLLNELPIHARADQNARFRNANGVYMKLCNFLRFDPSYKGAGLKAGSHLEKEVWNEFSGDRNKLAQIVQAIRANYKFVPPPDTDDSDDDEACEGRILTQLHKIRERNRKLTNKKKLRVLKESGRLACEVCDFDFADVYGALGQGFAECHHRKPVSELQAGDKTKLSDLAIVCANCHRIIHRSKPWIGVEELAQLLH